ncbi:PIN domain-containing protein [Streptomyces niveus]|uniref:PIN domain-containing protein n=1 Tax=Streptomyces niveus TaxID=193462 RepID=UPI00378EE0BE
MSKKPVPPTYAEHLLSELSDIKDACTAVLEGSQVRAREMSGGGVQIIGHPWAWVPSTPEIEARRMAVLRDVRDWEPRFRLLFPHPTPEVQRRLDDSVGLLGDWLDRGGKVKHRAPQSIPRGVARIQAAVERLRGLVDLLPADEWRVRVVVDTNTLMDNPDVALYQNDVGSRYMVHILPVVLRELDDLKRSNNRPERRESARKAERRLKAMRDNGDVRKGARVAGDVHVVFEHIEPRSDGLPDWLDLDVPDDRLIASVLRLQSRHPGSKVYTATSDLNLQTKLAATGLPYMEGPQPDPAP